MNEIWQQLIVGAIVASALIYLWRQSRKSGCQKGGGCGCDLKKPTLKR